MPLRLYPRSRHRSARQSRRPAWWRNAFRIVGASRQRSEMQMAAPSGRQTSWAYNPHDFGRPLPCSTARSTHCALVAPAPASATTSDRWYGDGNGSPGRREFSGRISRILPREPLPSVATRRSPTTFLAIASGCACRAFVYGDFRRIHRMGLIACSYRAAESRHKKIELTADELLQYLDTKSERRRKR